MVDCVVVISNVNFPKKIRKGKTRQSHRANVTNKINHNKTQTYHLSLLSIFLQYRWVEQINKGHKINLITEVTYILNSKIYTLVCILRKKFISTWHCLTNIKTKCSSFLRFHWFERKTFEFEHSKYFTKTQFEFEHSKCFTKTKTRK